MALKLYGDIKKFLIYFHKKYKQPHPPNILKFGIVVSLIFFNSTSGQGRFFIDQFIDKAFSK